MGLLGVMLAMVVGSGLMFVIGWAMITVFSHWIATADLPASNPRGHRQDRSSPHADVKRRLDGW